MAGTRSVPIVLLGRVGLVEEAWSILNDKSGLNPPIFDIELFQPDRAKTFVQAAIKRLSKAEDSATKKRIYPHLEAALVAHHSVYERAATSLVDHLTSETSADGRQFAGYAPVLEAVATVIASESNPGKIDDAIASIFKGQVLGRVSSEVMIREAGKLSKQFAATVSGLNSAGLYEAQEQLSRLASLVLGAGSPKLTEESGIVHESELEAAFVRLAILCPAVLSIQAQPFRLDWIDEDGIARQYVPDYLVTLSDRHRVVVEVSISSCSEGSQWLPPFPWFARTSTVQSRGGTLRSWPALP